MAHTPGPWEIRKRSQKMTITGNVHQVTDKEGYPSAFVPAWDDPQDGEVDGSMEAIANASLISAAPDLLEALRYIHANVNLSPSEEKCVRIAILKADGKVK